MSEKLCKKECAGCPRSVMADDALNKVKMLKEAHLSSAADMMDDDLAAEVVEAFNELGEENVFEGIEDFRKSLGDSLEHYDLIETAIFARRQEETQFCVGALTMKATSGSTQYGVTLCRSPLNPSPGPLQRAVVKKKNV